ncbi:CAP domain-containing protein [Hathewaya histolytica]|uniref:CAP domain-containing protein n=1 Tax=Hathewaya histolytica TaxID=1498 RepID=UPI003B68307B
MNKMSKILSVTTATLMSLSLTSSVYARGLNCNAGNNVKSKIVYKDCSGLNKNEVLSKYGFNKSCNIDCNKKVVTTNNQGNKEVSKPDTKTPVAPAKPAEKPQENSGDKATSGNFAAQQNEVLNLVNAERSKAGLKPLKLNAELNKVATLKSEDMIKNNYFSHNSPTYGSPFDMMKKFGVSYTSAGENIAMGQPSPSEVMKGWMNSSGHRANILNGSFTELGVGVAKDSNGRLYWTQMFIGK